MSLNKKIFLVLFLIQQGFYRSPHSTHLLFLSPTLSGCGYLTLLLATAPPLHKDWLLLLQNFLPVPDLEIVAMTHLPSELSNTN